MPGKTAVPSEPIVSRDRIKDVMFRLLRSEVIVARRFTAEQLADESGVGVEAIRSYMKGSPAARKEASLSSALSIAAVLGPKAVNALLAVIGYAAHPLEDPDEVRPGDVVAGVMREVAVMAEIAADGRVIHTEEERWKRAHDNIIELVTPGSSAGEAA